MNKTIEKFLGDYLVFQIREWRKKWDSTLQEEIKKRIAFYSIFIKPGDLCFDIGANMGNRIGPLLKIGARVVAVEPQEKCIKTLRFKFGDRIEIVKKGVDATEGMRTFHISNETTISSFSEDWIRAVKAGRFQAYDWETTVEMSMTTLDALIGSHGLPAFIKIDVEGFEPEVLKGLSQPVRMISFEYTVPEQTDKSLQCIELLERNSKNILCNYSIGESMELAWMDWVSPSEMKQHIASSEFIKTGFGDIYVKCIS